MSEQQNPISSSVETSRSAKTALKSFFRGVFSSPTSKDQAITQTNEALRKAASAGEIANAEIVTAYREVQLGELSLVEEVDAFMDGIVPGVVDYIRNPGNWAASVIESTPIFFAPIWSWGDFIGAARAAEAFVSHHYLESILKIIIAGVPFAPTRPGQLIIDELMAKRYARAAIKRERAKKNEDKPIDLSQIGYPK